MITPSDTDSLSPISNSGTPFPSISINAYPTLFKDFKFVYGLLNNGLTSSLSVQF